MKNETWQKQPDGTMLLIESVEIPDSVTIPSIEDIPATVCIAYDTSGNITGITVDAPSGDYITHDLTPREMQEIAANPTAYYIASDLQLYRRP